MKNVIWLEQPNLYLGKYHLWTPEEFEYLEDLEREYMSTNNTHSLTERELLVIFPEAEPLLKARIRREIATLRHKKDSLYKTRESLPLKKPSDQIAIDLIDDEIKTIDGQLKKLSFKLNPPPINNKNSINEQDIENAKSVSLIDLYGDKLRHQGNRFHGKCPWHKDDTPSFVIYKDQNSFYCFSCNTSGDSINYVMKDKSLTFIEAVKWLLNK